MRIGLVTVVYKPVQNGVTRLVSLYKKYLELEGHDVFIFTFGEAAGNDEKGVILSPGTSIGQTGYSFAFRFSTRARNKLNSMDVVHYHHPVMALAPPFQERKAPIVFTNHTRYDLYAATFLPLPDIITTKAMRQLWPMMVSKSDWIIAPSERVARKLGKLGITRPISVIRNGIEFESPTTRQKPISKSELSVPEEAVLLIYVGRLSAEKRVDQLLDIFSLARASIPGLYLVLVGDGPSRRRLELQVLEKELGKFVSFIGEVPFESVPDYLAASDIFVTASDSEVHPLTVIEAMASGLPVVGRYARGLSETVDHGTNGYVKSGSNMETAEAIVKLVASPELRNKMGSRSLELSKSFHITRTVDQTLEIYRRLIEIYQGKSSELNGKRRRKFFLLPL